MGGCNGKSAPSVTNEPAEPPKSATPEIQDVDHVANPSENDPEGVCI